jgi:hypothetical protein
VCVDISIYLVSIYLSIHGVCVCVCERERDAHSAIIHVILKEHSIVSLECTVHYHHMSPTQLDLHHIKNCKYFVVVDLQKAPQDLVVL